MRTNCRDLQGMGVKVVAIILVACYAYVRSFTELIDDVASSIMIMQTLNPTTRCCNQNEIETHNCIEAKLILE